MAVQADTEYAASDNALTLYFKPDPGFSGTASFRPTSYLGARNATDCYPDRDRRGGINLCHARPNRERKSSRSRQIGMVKIAWGDPHLQMGLRKEDLGTSHPTSSDCASEDRPANPKFFDATWTF